MSNTIGGLCDCCEEQSDGLASADDGESWVCPACVKSFQDADAALRYGQI